MVPEYSCSIKAAQPSGSECDTLAGIESIDVGKPALQQTSKHKNKNGLVFLHKNITGYQKAKTPQGIRKRCFKLEKSRKDQEKQDIFNLFPDREIPDRGIFRCRVKMLPKSVRRNLRKRLKMSGFSCLF